jgi:hypothetical protein
MGHVCWPLENNISAIPVRYNMTVLTCNLGLSEEPSGIAEFLPLAEILHQQPVHQRHRVEPEEPTRLMPEAGRICM